MLYIQLHFFFYFGNAVEFHNQVSNPTHAPCSGSMESQPLDHQESPSLFFYSDIIDL